MGIFKKFSDLARSSLNAFLNEVEDKKKLREQELLDLQETKKKAQKLLVSAMAALKATEARKQQEDLSEEAKKSLELALEQERQAILTIKNGLIALDKKMSELRSHFSQASAKETLEDQKPFETFDRMHEKIEQTEFENEALNELFVEKETTSKGPYDKYSDPKLLEKELLALKKKLKDD